MIILGLDPGTNRTGYGLIEKNKRLSADSRGLSNKGRDPAAVKRGLRLITYGVIEIKKSDYSRLKILGEKISAIIKKYKPDIAAVEKLYFSKNKKTALSVAEARGVIIFAASKAGIPILEFSPNEVKAAVAGYGKSDKKTVEKFTAITLGVPEIRGSDDASDALAIAIRASFERGIDPHT